MKKNIITFFVFLSMTGCSLWNNSTPLSPATPKVPAVNKNISVNPLQDSPAPVADFTTTMKLSSDKTTVKKGGEFVVTVLLSGAQEGVTTAGTQVHFNSTVIQPLSINTADSAFPLEFRNNIDLQKGIVDISRSHSKGVTGDNIILVKMTFRALQEGDATLYLDPHKTIVLLKDDENATPPINSFKDIIISITS